MVGALVIKEVSGAFNVPSSVCLKGLCTGQEEARRMMQWHHVEMNPSTIGTIRERDANVCAQMRSSVPFPMVLDPGPRVVKVTPRVPLHLVMNIRSG